MEQEPHFLKTLIPIHTNPSQPAEIHQFWMISFSFVGFWVMKEMKFREDIAHFSGRNDMGNWDYFTPVSGVMGPGFLGPPCSKG